MLCFCSRPEIFTDALHFRKNISTALTVYLVWYFVRFARDFQITSYVPNWREGSCILTMEYNLTTLDERIFFFFVCNWLSRYTSGTCNANMDLSQVQREKGGAFNAIYSVPHMSLLGKQAFHGKIKTGPEMESWPFLPGFLEEKGIGLPQQA